MSYVKTTDGVKLYYKDWGAGRPVVMMHGWPLSSDTFDDLSMALADNGMRAISYDRRGFGRSQQPWDGYDYDTLAGDLAAVLEHTQARDVTLLGFSMGGGEVARYLSKHGAANVKQAILIASIVPYMLKTEDNPSGTPQAMFDKIGAGLKADRAKFWSGFFKDFYGTTVSDEVKEWSRDQSMHASLKATLACAKSFGTTDLRPDLKAFTMPTLIIHGTDDKTVPIDASARAAAAGIPGSTLIEYDGGSHGLLASHKDRVIADVLKFVKG